MNMPIMLNVWFGFIFHSSGTGKTFVTPNPIAVANMMTSGIRIEA